MSATPATADRNRRVSRTLALPTLLGALLVAIASGCGNDKGSNPVITPVPENSTPAGTLARFDALYQAQDAAEFGKLFTSDFSFHFSTQSDPNLAQQYGFNWGKDDEIVSATHLFDGFTSTDPPFETFGPATHIELAFVNPEILDDLLLPDSSRFYKYVVVPTADLTITVVNGSVETIYEISSHHDFYLARGDVAHLDAGQPADSLHWYIRRWDDMSVPSASPQGAGQPLSTSRIMPTEPASWGKLKAQYR